MARATTTIRQVLNYRSDVQEYFAANQSLFNQVASFYFEVIQAHGKILDLENMDALRALEQLTHTTESNPHPVRPLCEIQEDIPAMFRRAAINAALGSARSFSANLSRWRKYKEKAEAKGKKFKERPPVPPRTWNKSATLYAGMWKDRMGSSILIKVWTGLCWSWIRVRITGREIPDGVDLGSPQLVRRGKQWWLHTPLEKSFKSPGKVEKQIKTNSQTKICAVDLNINEHLAVCTIQTVEGSILATLFIGGGQRVNGFRKKQLGRIARNRHKTGIIAEGEQDNADLWTKIRHVDEQLAHLVSSRIVQFAKKHEATILVFEHLGNLKPTKGKYSKRSNEKRAFWMKGRIFKYNAYFLPTKVGDYTFHIFGTLNNNSIDEKFTSSPTGFNAVEQVPSYPSNSADSVNAEVTTLKSQVQSAQNAATTATTVGIIGLVLGALGLLVAGRAIARKPKLTEASVAEAKMPSESLRG